MFNALSIFSYLLLGSLCLLGGATSLLCESIVNFQVPGRLERDGEARNNPDAFLFCLWEFSSHTSEAKTIVLPRQGTLQETQEKHRIAYEKRMKRDQTDEQRKKIKAYKNLRRATKHLGTHYNG